MSDVVSAVLAAATNPAPPDAVVLPLAGQSVVAISSPSGLVASTGNLDWTSNSKNEFV